VPRLKGHTTIWTSKKDEGDSDTKMDVNHYNYVVDLLRVVLASSVVANKTLI
jgi:hypothetical protein